MEKEWEMISNTHVIIAITQVLFFESPYVRDELPRRGDPLKGEVL